MSCGSLPLLRREECGVILPGDFTPGASSTDPLVSAVVFTAPFSTDYIVTYQAVTDLGSNYIVTTHTKTSAGFLASVGSVDLTCLISLTWCARALN